MIDQGLFIYFNVYQLSISILTARMYVDPKKKIWKLNSNEHSKQAYWPHGSYNILPAHRHRHRHTRIQKHFQIKNNEI